MTKSQTKGENEIKASILISILTSSKIYINNYIWFQFVFLLPIIIFLKFTCSIYILRELPEPVLTNELSAIFEEAAATKDTRTRQTELNSLISQLPRYNKQLLAWLMIHFDNVTTYVSIIYYMWNKFYIPIQIIL